MAQKIPFFELFTDFSPDFDLRVPLNAAMVTNMVLEPEKRTMTLDMTVRAEMNDSTRETVEQLLARSYDLKRVSIRVKSTAEAFPDMLKNAGRKVSGSGSVIMGREIAKGRVLPISELTPKAGHVVVEGKVFKFDCHETRRAGVWTMLLEMTDYKGSLFIRRSMPEREATELLGKISVGMWLRVSGRMELSYDGKDMQLNPQDIMQIDHAERTDTAEEKRVELHLHTRMSNMDALTDTAAVVKRAIKWGMPAIAITDHGVAQSFPDAWHTGEGKIKLLYGCEGYFLNNIDDRICVHGPQDGDFSTEICCFDIETTGLKVAHDAITEIGAVILKGGEIVDTFQTFVDPERRLSPEIIGLTGITDDMLRGAPKLEDALHAFLDFAGDRPLAAHNAEFDISFIRAGCKKCGIPFEPTYLDSRASSTWGRRCSSAKGGCAMYNRYLRNDDGVYTRMPMQDAPRGEPPRDNRPPPPPPSGGVFRHSTTVSAPRKAESGFFPLPRAAHPAIIHICVKNVTGGGSHAGRQTRSGPGKKPGLRHRPGGRPGADRHPPGGPALLRHLAGGHALDPGQREKRFGGHQAGGPPRAGGRDLRERGRERCRWKACMRRWASPSPFTNTARKF